MVVCAATLAELTGSILWGVYSYRLHTLPAFVPPAHGLVFMAGLSLSEALRRHARTLVVAAAAIAATWGMLGLTVLPRKDAAGALGVPLLLAFLWRSRARAAYAGVFVVVAALELYGTAIGTWRWAEHLPGTGIPDGNPPSGVASGYVWFDVMALLLAPRLPAAWRGVVRRVDPHLEELRQVLAALRFREHDELRRGDGAVPAETTWRTLRGARCPATSSAAAAKNNPRGRLTEDVGCGPPRSSCAHSRGEKAISHSPGRVK